MESINVCLTAAAGNRAESVYCKTYTITGSFENEALENEDRSTKHPNLENEAPKTRKRSTLDRKRSTLSRKRSTQNSKTKTPKYRKRSTQNSKTKTPKSSIFVFECFVFETTHHYMPLAVLAFREQGIHIYCTVKIIF